MPVEEPRFARLARPRAEGSILACLVLSVIAAAAHAQTPTQAPNSGDSPPPAHSADPYAKACAPVTEDGEVRLDRNCLAAMAFNPRFYFDRGDENVSDPLELNGLVEVVFVQGRRGPIWAFAISNSCPGRLNADSQCKGEQLRPLLRAVTIKPPDRQPKPRMPFPRSEAGMRGFLDRYLDWREADLRTCPHALDALTALNDVPWQVFDEGELALLAGREPSEIVVTADGDTVVVKASGFVAAHAARDGGEPGGAGAWAKTMRAAVEPCLKPTQASAPWSTGG